MTPNKRLALRADILLAVTQASDIAPTDIAIIGGGIVGLATALALRDRYPLVVEDGGRMIAD